MIIVGIDPGDTTGMFTYNTNTLSHTAQHHTDIDQLLARIRNFTTWSEVFIGMERFHISERTVRSTRQPKVLDVIGAVKALGVPIIEQNASDAKHIGTDEVLKSIGWYTPRLRHANDAARHCLLLLARKDLKSFDKLVS